MNFLSSFKRSTIQRLDDIFNMTHGAMSVVGLFTVLLLSLQMINQGIVVSISGDSAAIETGAGKDTVALGDGRMPVSSPLADSRQHVIARHLSRSYRIAPEAADELVAAAFAAGRIVGLDPVLILAVMAVESRFNPIAESDMGAKGLMQVIPKYHLDKLNSHGGAGAVLDPWVNILVGAQILREYVARAGSLASGLQQYNGASTDRTMQYSGRIFTEKSSFERILQSQGIQLSETKV